MSEAAASEIHRRIAEFTAFATMGALSTTQDIARIILGKVEGSESEIVAEETLCMVATGTARAATVGLRSDTTLAEAVVPTLMNLPYTYRDYLVGSVVMEEDNAEESTVEAMAEEVTQRLERKQEFYNLHLPEGQFPGKRVLGDKMELWMGRVSPPKLPTTPADRLEQLQLVPKLRTHLRLILSYGRQYVNDREASPEE
jgi:hypothetical protein